MRAGRMGIGQLAAVSACPAPAGGFVMLALLAWIFGPSDDAAFLLAASGGLLGCGLAGLSLAGPSPLDRKSARSGMAILALGVLSLTIGWSATRGLSGEEVISSAPAIFFILGGYLGTFVGLVITAIALAVRALGSTAPGAGRPTV